MACKQIKKFSLSKMGRKVGWCLMNVRLGFGIPTGKYASAKDAMTADKKAGVFHAGMPTDKSIQVPIYCDTNSPYEHVVVWDKGTVYSDGKRISNPTRYYKIFGWTERCDGVRVVEIIKAPAKKSNETIAKEVIQGKWGNGLIRKQKLQKAGYNYNTIQALVNKMLRK